jgi:Secretory lipase
MKNVFYIVISVFCSLIQPIHAADRGDIVSFELVKEWNNEQAIEESLKLVEGYTGVLGNDPELQEGVRNFLRSYVKRNFEARSLKFYKLVYHTVDADDQPAIASGLVIFPQRPASTCKYGMAVYNHGTLFGRFEAPSYYFENGQYRGGELFFSIIMAAMEHFTLVPDYYGMGDGTGLHHHNMEKTNANANIDMIRAGRKMAAQLNMELTQRVVITGYSEGGTVTMGTAKRIFEDGLTNEFPQLFLGPASGAYDMSEEAYKYIVLNPFYPTRAYILYIAASCQDLYKNLYDPNDPNGIKDYLVSPYDELYNINLLGQTGNVGWVPLPWPQMFKNGVIEEVESNPNHPLRDCLRKNDTYNWKNPYETFTYYCNTDEQVPPSGAVKKHTVQQSFIPANRFWERFRLRLSEMSFDGAIPDHGTCALPSMLFFMEEMRARKRNICRPNRISEDGITIDADGEPLLFNLPAAYADAPIEVKGLDGKSKTFLPNQQQQYNISTLQPGIYLYRTQLANGRTDWDYFLKAPLHFVNTDDYNPIQTDINGRSRVDISLLSEPVRRLEVYDAQGNRVKVIPNTAAATDKITLNGRFATGEHTVMVITDEKAFPLKWQVSERMANSSSDKFVVYTENGMAQIRTLSETNIQAIQLFDVQGKQLMAKNGLAEQNVQIIMNEYPAGMYLIMVNGSESFKVVR